MFYVYVLENETGNVYIGRTSNLKKRLLEHNQGRTSATKNHSWRCIYYEAGIEMEDARRRERYLKTTQGRRMLSLRLKEYRFKKRAS